MLPAITVEKEKCDIYEEKKKKKKNRGGPTWPPTSRKSQTIYG